MKLHTKIIVKSLSLTILLSYFVIGLHAKNDNSSFLAINTQNNVPITDTKLNNNLSIQDEIVIEEEIQIESWMEDKDFWKIEKSFFQNEDSVKESSEIEEWINIFNKQEVGYINKYSDFKEKEWMKKHTFIIL